MNKRKERQDNLHMQKYFSMWTGYKNAKKCLPDDESRMVLVMLALLFGDRTGDTVFTVQRTEKKERENGFCGVSPTFSA